MDVKPRFIVDARGRRVAAILDMATYRRILQELEELECLRAYEAAKACGEEGVPLDQALCEVERLRACRTE